MTTQPKTHKPTGMELVKTVLMSSDVMTRFASIMGERESAYYINSVILAVANSTDLQECAPTSIVYSALRAAALKLSCDQSLGEAYLVPFFNSKKEVKEAVFIPGYKGLRNLATRTGKYRFVNAGPIYNGMQVEEDVLTGRCKVVGQRIDDTILGWFAHFEMMNGYAKTLYMTVEQIHDHAQRYSKTYNSKKSLWQTDPQMAEKKTVLRLLLQRWADLGSAANEALKHDEDILEGKFEIDIPDEVPDAPRQSVEQNMNDLGFDAAPGTYVHTAAPTDPQPMVEVEARTLAELGWSNTEIESYSTLPEPNPEPQADLFTAERPFNLAQLQAALREWAAKYVGLACTLKHRGLLANALTTSLGGSEDARHDFDLHVFGAASLNVVDDTIVLAALKTWYGVSGWNGTPDPMAVTETRAIYDEISIPSDQPKLL